MACPPAETPQGVAVEAVQLTCVACHREVPASVSVSAEATDYVVHFCGIDCYDRWRRAEALKPAGATP